MLTLNLSSDSHPTLLLNPITHFLSTSTLKTVCTSLAETFSPTELHLSRYLDDLSTHKLTTRHFDPNKTSTQKTVCCDNLLLLHSGSYWTDWMSTQNRLSGLKNGTFCHSIRFWLVVIICPQELWQGVPWFQGLLILRSSGPDKKDETSPQNLLSIAEECEVCVLGCPLRDVNVSTTR
jgi:hypothetical protein